MLYHGIKHKTTTFLREEKGQALVEFVLAFVFLFLLVYVALFEGWRSLEAKHRVIQTSRYIGWELAYRGAAQHQIVEEEAYRFFFQQPGRGGEPLVARKDFRSQLSRTSTLAWALLEGPTVFSTIIPELTSGQPRGLMITNDLLIVEMRSSGKGLFRRLMSGDQAVSEEFVLGKGAPYARMAIIAGFARDETTGRRFDWRLDLPAQTDAKAVQELLWLARGTILGAVMDIPVKILTPIAGLFASIFFFNHDNRHLQEPQVNVDAGMEEGKDAGG